MSCCCCVSSTPTEDVTGRIRVYEGDRFQVDALSAMWAGPTYFFWFLAQCCPCTCGVTQYFLRRKVLKGDMTKYSCFQGYLNCLCFRAGSCGEHQCPDFCLCAEACCCNALAMSATRMYVMEKYDLGSDPCDFRLIRINNCIQLFACFCDIASAFNEDLRDCAKILDWIADLTFHCVSGCFTAQVAYEVDYQHEVEEVEKATNQLTYQADVVYTDKVYMY